MPTYSVTERQTWLRCKRQWNYGSFNRQSLAPLSTPLAFNTGSLWHKAHAEWMLKPEADLRMLILHEGNVALDELKIRYQQRVGAAPSQTEIDEVYEAVILLAAMAVNYQTYWGSPLPPDFEVIAPEQTIILAVPDIHGCSSLTSKNHWHLCKCNSHFDCETCQAPCAEPISIEGTLDGLIRHIPTQRCFVGERKTYERKPNEIVMNFADQFLNYMWLVHYSGISDLPVGGIAYDGAWKRSAPNAKYKQTIV